VGSKVDHRIRKIVQRNSGNKGSFAKQGTRKLNPKVDLTQGDSSVLLGHPQLVDTMSFVIQSWLIYYI
jgi:hypothetical protein